MGRPVTAERPIELQQLAAARAFRLLGCSASQPSSSEAWHRTVIATIDFTLRTAPRVRLRREPVRKGLLKQIEAIELIIAQTSPDLGRTYNSERPLDLSNLLVGVASSPGGVGVAKKRLCDALAETRELLRERALHVEPYQDREAYRELLTRLVDALAIARGCDVADLSFSEEAGPRAVGEGTQNSAFLMNVLEPCFASGCPDVIAVARRARKIVKEARDCPSVSHQSHGEVSDMPVVGSRPPPGDIGGEEASSPASGADPAE